MPVNKVLPPNTIAISNLANKQMEALASRYDSGKKGYLTYTEACQLYADKNGNALPPNLEAVISLLGGTQHPMTGRRLNGWEAMSAGWIASNWKGDFNIGGFGAGNVRTGRQTGQEFDAAGQARQVDKFIFLVDCNLVDRSKLEGNITSATLVVGPRGFGKEQGSQLGENVEVPLTVATQEGYMTYDRASGSHWVDEKKYLAAAVDTKDLRDLAGQSGGLSFYVRLETNDGRTLYVNKNGQAFNNFDVSSKETKPVGSP